MHESFEINEKVYAILKLEMVRFAIKQLNSGHDNSLVNAVLSDMQVYKLSMNPKVQQTRKTLICMHLILCNI